MKIYKIISLALMLVLILGILLACDNAPAADDSPTTADSQENGTPPDENSATERLTPNLPEADFNGHVFTFLSHYYTGDDWVGSLPRELVSEAEIGEPVNDAVFRRNMTIKERFNIEIRMLYDADEAGALRRAVSAGDDIYDAVLMFNNHVPGIVTGNLLLNTEALTYIDLDQPWWDDATKEMSIANRHFLLGGDILILDNEATNAMLFNKELMASLGLDLPYNLVKEGRWTFDALHSYIRDGYADLSGTGVMSPYEDRFGMLVFNDTLHAFLVSGGGTLARKNADDMPYMTLVEPRNIAVFDRALEFFNTPYTLNIQQMPAGFDHHASFIGTFEESRALFMWMRMRAVEWFRGMDADFGIVPLPKFDEAQANYYSVVNTWSGALLGVPRSVADAERASIILEALAAESRYTLQPAYYDIVLTRKYARDEESEDMLDIIFNSRVYDIGAVYGFGNVWIDYLGLANGRMGVQTFFERGEGRMLRDIERIVEIFEAMD